MPPPSTSCITRFQTNRHQGYCYCECNACVKQYAAATVTAYLDAVASRLQDLQSGAKSPSEQRQFGVLTIEFAKLRSRVAPAIAGQVAANFAAFLRGQDGTVSGTNSAPFEGALSLVESVDLRVVLVVTEAIHKLAARLRGVWQELEQRLGQIAPHKTDSSPLAPALLCHQFRDAVFYDDQFGALRQIDLTAGFSDDFIAQLDMMYGALNSLLESHGIHACAPPAAKLSVRPPNFANR